MTSAGNTARASTHRSVAMNRSIRYASLALSIALAAGAVQAQPAGTLNEDFIYRVRPGDTLIGLATTYTGKESNWPALQQLNKIADTLALPVAMELRIPLAMIPEVPGAARSSAWRAAPASTGSRPARAARCPKAAYCRPAPAASSRCACRTTARSPCRPTAPCSFSACAASSVCRSPTPWSRWRKGRWNPGSRRKARAWAASRSAPPWLSRACAARAFASRPAATGPARPCWKAMCGCRPMRAARRRRK